MDGPRCRKHPFWPSFDVLEITYSDGQNDRMAPKKKQKMAEASKRPDGTKRKDGRKPRKHRMTPKSVKMAENRMTPAGTKADRWPKKPDDTSRVVN